MYSYDISSNSPFPLRIAFFILFNGLFAAYAISIAVLSLAFIFRWLPPIFVDTVISLTHFVKIFPLLASAAAFLCFILTYLLWPDIFPPGLINF